jgi:hypothetical protein
MTESQSIMQDKSPKTKNVSIQDHATPIGIVMATERSALRESQR